MNRLPLYTLILASTVALGQYSEPYYDPYGEGYGTGYYIEQQRETDLFLKQLETDRRFNEQEQRLWEQDQRLRDLEWKSREGYWR